MAPLLRAAFEEVFQARLLVVPEGGAGESGGVEALLAETAEAERAAEEAAAAAVGV